MKGLAVATLAGFAAALPQFVNPKTGQPTGWGGFLGTLDISNLAPNDLTKGPCRDIILVVARGSMEPGDIGVTVGPPLCKGLKAKYGEKFGCHGIDPKGYSAAILDNTKPKGTSDASIDAGVKAFKDINQKCPNAKLLFEGYSQGAAVMHNVVPLLPEVVKKQIIGGVLFGDTKNKQSNATIEGVPKDNLLSICAKDDGVCWGGLSVTAGHVVYTQNGDLDRALSFFTQKIDASLPKKS